MTRKKERITAYVDEATADDIKHISDRTNISMSKLLSLAIAKMAYLETVSQGIPTDKLVKRIFAAFGFPSATKAQGKIEITSNETKIEIDTDGNLEDITKRLLQLQKKLSTEALKTGQQPQTKLMLALPLIAQEIRIFGDRAEELSKERK